MLAVAHDVPSALDQLLGRIESSILPVVVPRPGSWGYARSSAPDLYRALADCGSPDERRLLDVGSGIGSMVHLMFLFGWENVSGVEWVPEYRDRSLALFPEHEVHLADAWEFDYSSYDIVYSSGIETDAARQQEHDAFVRSQLHAGAVLIAPGRHDDSR